MNEGRKLVALNWRDGYPMFCWWPETCLETVGIDRPGRKVQPYNVPPDLMGRVGGTPALPWLGAGWNNAKRDDAGSVLRWPEMRGPLQPVRRADVPRRMGAVPQFIKDAGGACSCKLQPATLRYWRRESGALRVYRYRVLAPAADVRGARKHGDAGRWRWSLAADAGQAPMMLDTPRRMVFVGVGNGADAPEQAASDAYTYSAQQTGGTASSGMKGKDGDDDDGDKKSASTSNVGWIVGGVGALVLVVGGVVILTRK